MVRRMKRRVKQQYMKMMRVFETGFGWGEGGLIPLCSGLLLKECKGLFDNPTAGKRLGIARFVDSVKREGISESFRYPVLLTILYECVDFYYTWLLSPRQ